jgi:hypothetical protein
MAVIDRAPPRLTADISDHLKDTASAGHTHMGLNAHTIHPQPRLLSGYPFIRLPRLPDSLHGPRFGIRIAASYPVI